MQVIYHIDMNAFFASCEVNEHPEYQNKPLIVAHRSRRGIVTTASYEARRYGIHSAMPTYLAIQKCPNIIIVEPHFELYRRVSAAFFKIVASYSDKIEIASIDECYVDVTQAIEMHGGILELAKKMQTQIYDTLKIPCSIGIAPNKFLAKMASDMRKPLGITILTRSNIKDKLWPLPIDQMYGIGKKTAPKLKEVGILTIKDLADSKNYAKARNILGSLTLIYYQHANGFDFSKVDADNHDLKSIGHSTTFQTDLSDDKEIKDVLKNLTRQVAQRAQKHHLVGNQISVTLKYTRFESTVRSMPIGEYSHEYEVLIGYVLILFERYYDGRPLRLVGVSLHNTINERTKMKQLSLFDYQKEKPVVKNPTDELLKRLNQKHHDRFIRASQLNEKKNKHKNE